MCCLTLTHLSPQCSFHVLADFIILSVTSCKNVKHDFLLFSLGTKDQTVTKTKKKFHTLLSREKFFFFFFLSDSFFSHWVTQFHAPLAYLGWCAMKSVQFGDFRGTVFWNLLRYVAVLLSAPLDRLHYYVKVAKGETVVIIHCVPHWNLLVSNRTATETIEQITNDEVPLFIYN